MGGEKEISWSNPIAWKVGGGLERTHMALKGTMALTTQTSVSQHFCSEVMHNITSLSPDSSQKCTGLGP